MVEKSLKGFLAFKGTKFEPIHNLRVLSGLVLKHDSSLKSLLDQAIEFGPYFVAYRYPDANVRAKEATLESATEAVKIAEKIFSEITSRIPFETQWDL